MPGATVMVPTEFDVRDLYLYSFDGEGLLLDVETGVKTLLMSDAPVDSHPVFSPDGTKILFTSRDRGDTERDIWVMYADGGNLTQLTAAPGVARRHPDRVSGHHRDVQRHLGHEC